MSNPTRLGGHRLPVTVTHTTMRHNINRTTDHHPIIGKATGAATPRHQHRRPDPGGRASKPARTAPRGNTSRSHNTTEVNATRGLGLIASSIHGHANRDPGFTNVRIVECTLRDLVPDLGGCVP